MNSAPYEERARLQRELIIIIIIIIIIIKLNVFFNRKELQIVF